MRKLIYAINITMDGCCDHTKATGGEEILDHYTHLLSDAGLLVYGRKTYQLMVPYWPDVLKDQSATKAEKEFARTFDSINKVVFQNRWTKLKEIRGSFVQTLKTKSLD